MLNQLHFIQEAFLSPKLNAPPYQHKGGHLNNPKTPHNFGMRGLIEPEYPKLVDEAFLERLAQCDQLIPLTGRNACWRHKQEQHRRVSRYDDRVRDSEGWYHDKKQGLVHREVKLARSRSEHPDTRQRSN